MTDGLSAYELERLANIQRNEEQLEALGLGGGVVPQEAKAPRAKKQKREPPPPQEPSRRSSRVRNAPADNVYIADEDDGGKVRLGGRDAAKTAAGRPASPQRPHMDRSQATRGAGALAKCFDRSFNSPY